MFAEEAVRRLAARYGPEGRQSERTGGACPRVLPSGRRRRHRQGRGGHPGAPRGAADGLAGRRGLRARPGRAGPADPHLRERADPSALRATLAGRALAGWTGAGRHRLLRRSLRHPLPWDGSAFEILPEQAKEGRRRRSRSRYPTWAASRLSTSRFFMRPRSTWSSAVRSRRWRGSCAAARRPAGASPSRRSPAGARRADRAASPPVPEVDLADVHRLRRALFRRQRAGVPGDLGRQGGDHVHVGLRAGRATPARPSLSNSPLRLRTRASCGP